MFQGIVKMAETRAREKMKKEEKKEKKQEIKKKGRRVQHRLRRKKLLTVTLLPLSLRLKKTQRIQEENTPAKRGKSKYHTWV